jgi:hypothetical protein
MALHMIIGDLRSQSPKTVLRPILDKQGGRYMARANMDSTMVNIYTSVNPTRISTDKRGLGIEMTMDTPPGPGRLPSTGKRVEYWKTVSRKRLMQGGLVGMLWQSGKEIQIFFGLISSSADDLISSARQGNEFLRLRVKFFDPAVNLRVMEWCQLDQRDKRGLKILLMEAPVMYESIRPFLEALQREPTSFPFAQYLVHRQEGRDDGHLMQVSPPRYTVTRPSFKWDLSCLFNGDEKSLQLDPSDPLSIQQARTVLRASSRLDSSQADAMVDSLTKEFCMIQGPPGTGKVRCLFLKRI